nr:unnamed protein product [Callosobruchus chinensis]
MISDINAFIKKLEFWELSLINRDAKHIPTFSEKLSQNTLQPYRSRCHVESVSNLKQNFKNRFEDFNKPLLLDNLVFHQS